jgi:hypothetical protein
MEREQRGRGHIVLIVPLAEGREAEVTLPGRYAMAPPTRAAIKAIPGVVDVRES